MDRPVPAAAVRSRRMGVAVEEGAPDAETALTMKLNGAENSAGPASRRRDNIGAPARRAAAHNNTHSERLENRAGFQTAGA